MVSLLKETFFFIYLVISFTYCLVGFFNFPLSSCDSWYLFRKQNFGFLSMGFLLFSPVVAC